MQIRQQQAAEESIYGSPGSERVANDDTKAARDEFSTTSAGALLDSPAPDEFPSQNLNKTPTNRSEEHTR